jgi:hypothetical protein
VRGGGGTSMIISFSSKEKVVGGVCWTKKKDQFRHKVKSKGRKKLGERLNFWSRQLAERTTRRLGGSRIIKGEQEWPFEIK